jgi:polyphosphate kinase 2 (PPK2 family)
MFEAAELGRTLDENTYKERLPQLREQLLDAQMQVRSLARFPVVVILGGEAGAGKGETVKKLSEWMDPRFLEVHAVGPASDEELERPAMWRFWRRLPRKGTIGVFFGGWYLDPIAARVFGKCRDAEFITALGEIRRFEQMLADEGALILKFWLHLSKKAQRRRFDELLADKKTRYRVDEDDLKQAARYDKYRSASARVLSETDLPHAPWRVIEGVDRRYRNWNTGEALLTAIQRRIAAEDGQHSAEGERHTAANGAEHAQPSAEADRRPAEDGSDGGDRSDSPAPTSDSEDTPIVRTLDLSLSLEKQEYKEKLETQQRRLALATQRRGFARLSPVLVFEGVDAAGKGGAIRRVTEALDARLYDVHSIAAPTDEEKRQPYLWRFWRSLPRDGKFAIYDRSWYGRVLVERVEGFATPAEWQRAYSEINDFEAQLVRAGNVVVKFWLQISKDEQLRRFHEREEVSFKRHKITPDDWRNRGKWDEHERAASDMIERTSTEHAPWTLVEAEDKRYARVKILKTVADAVERAERSAR